MITKFAVACALISNPIVFASDNADTQAKECEIELSTMGESDPKNNSNAAEQDITFNGTSDIFFMDPTAGCSIL